MAYPAAWLASRARLTVRAGAELVGLQAAGRASARLTSAAQITRLRSCYEIAGINAAAPPASWADIFAPSRAFAASPLHAPGCWRGHRVEPKTPVAQDRGIRRTRLPPSARPGLGDSDTAPPLQAQQNAPWCQMIPRRVAGQVMRCRAIAPTPRSPGLRGFALFLPGCCRRQIRGRHTPEFREKMVTSEFPIRPSLQPDSECHGRAGSDETGRLNTIIAAGSGFVVDAKIGADDRRYECDNVVAGARASTTAMAASGAGSGNAREAACYAVAISRAAWSFPPRAGGSTKIHAPRSGSPGEATSRSRKRRVRRAPSSRGG